MKLSNRVTTQLIKNAVTELERQGINPTLNLIRDHIGYVSNSTILEVWQVLKPHRTIAACSVVNISHKTVTVIKPIASR